MPEILPRQALTEEKYPPPRVAKLLGRGTQTIFRMARRHKIPTTGEGRRRTYSRDSVQQLTDLYAADLSVSTTNGYLFAFKGFTRWLLRNKRMGDDPLTAAKALNAKKCRRHKRRVLGGDEFQAFLAAGGGGAVFRGMTGSARGMIYLVAVNTGLRAQEIACLTPGHFSPDYSRLMLGANETKNGEDATIVLRKDLAAVLHRYLEGRSTDQKIWPGLWYKSGAEMVRCDLAVAGIPYRDSKNEVFDFHSLRRQFVNDLVRAKIAPKVVQTMARHSTIQMTLDVYAELSGLHELEQAVEALPGYHRVAQASDTSGQGGAVGGTDRPSTHEP